MNFLKLLFRINIQKLYYKYEKTIVIFIVIIKHKEIKKKNDDISFFEYFEMLINILWILCHDTN